MNTVGFVYIYILLCLILVKDLYNIFPADVNYSHFLERMFRNNASDNI